METDEITKEQFKQQDKRFDKIMEDRKSRVQNEKKIFMKISDVDIGDAMWFKAWCDKHTKGHQFLGIKIIKKIVENTEPLIEDVFGHINELSERVSKLESNVFADKEEKVEIVLPKTQGARK